MALKFAPGAGAVLICDFAGFVVPEMIKRRPVVVISGRRRRDKLATIVPLSTTEPVPKQAHHHELDPRSLPGHLAEKSTWAKCDMIATVGHHRLDRVRLRDPNRGRVYVSHQVAEEDLKGILRGVLCAINLERLTGCIR